MAANPEAPDPAREVDALAHMRGVEARVLAGAYERIHADVLRAQQLGIIDQHGNRISKEWPPEMRPLTPLLDRRAGEFERLRLAVLTSVPVRELRLG